MGGRVGCMVIIGHRSSKRYVVAIEIELVVVQ